jgi:hypothetical protein
MATPRASRKISESIGLGEDCTRESVPMDSVIRDCIVGVSQPQSRVAKIVPTVKRESMRMAFS